MQDLRIALIQSIQHWEDKKLNFSHFESRFLNSFQKGEADLILLPEMFNTGFSMNAKEMAEKMDGKSIAWLIQWANQLECHIGGSLIIEENGNYYNRFVIVSGNGVQTTYDKRHLFRMADEHQHFSSGENRVVYSLKGWRLMLQVCYDLRFPVFSRNRMVNGEKEYDVLMYIANWPKKRAFIWKNLIQARAIENQAYSIGLNRVGEDGKGIHYSGDSMVVDPWGNITEELEPHNEMVKIVTLQSKILKDIVRLFPAHLDAD